MRQLRTLAALLLVSGVLAGCAGQDWRDVSGALLQGTGRTDTQTVEAGLKEALRVGAQRAVEKASAEGGYADNPDIQIPLPSKLESMADSLRKVGLSGQFDKLKSRMNRAAEKAAAEATPVFIDAISDMSFADAREVLSGGETAATDYLRRETSDELRRRYRPIVEEKLQSVGVVKLYQSLHDRYQQIPLTPSVEFTPREYATDKALDGLFKLLAREEKRIREDPAARTTQLLQKVFGG